MTETKKGMPWLANVIIGVLIVAAGIFLLASPQDGHSVLIFIVALGILLYSLYNFFKAVQSRNDSHTLIPFLVHGLLDFVLFILILLINGAPGNINNAGSTAIKMDPNYLLSVILACWLIIFGLFGIIHAKQDGGENRQKIRLNVLLILIGIGLLVLPILLSIDSVIFLGIIGLVLGVIKTVHGIVTKTRLDKRTSSGRSNLI